MEHPHVSVEPHEPSQTAAQNTKVDSPVYFSVSLTKLALMSLCTFGLYELYWFYRNWKKLKEHTGKPIRPFWRAVFAVFYCHSCFRIIRDTGANLGLQRPPAAGLLATLWILVEIAYRLPNPYWLISLFSFVFMLPIQAYANRINHLEAPAHDRNARFRGWNWLALIGGGLFLLLVIVGAFTPNSK